MPPSSSGTSSLVGTESVNVKTGGGLELTGSVIANIKEDGTDGGNLRIDAKSLAVRGIDGSTLGVNVVGKDKGFISGVEALERIFHEYGHNQYGPGNEDGAASLGGFASWYGTNILATLYGFDPNAKTQAVTDWVRDNGDQSLAANNSLAEKMKDSGKTEFDGGSHWENHPYLYTPEKIAEFERTRELANQGAGYFWQGLDIDTDGKNWSEEERTGYYTAQLMGSAPYLASLAFLTRSLGRSNPSEAWGHLQETKNSRFVDGVTVTDRKTGQQFSGTVDLEPTLNRIKTGGSFPHRNDGTTFRNEQVKLPTRPDGYYTEYVHPTPNISGPGSQRVITGKGGEVYYTPNHYKTFIKVNP